MLFFGLGPFPSHCQWQSGTLTATYLHGWLPNCPKGLQCSRLATDRWSVRPQYWPNVINVCLQLHSKWLENLGCKSFHWILCRSICCVRVCAHVRHTTINPRNHLVKACDDHDDDDDARPLRPVLLAEPVRSVLLSVWKIAPKVEETVMALCPIYQLIVTQQGYIPLQSCRAVEAILWRS